MVDSETDKSRKEAIWIRKIAPTINKVEGGNVLCHVCDSFPLSISHTIWRTVKIQFRMKAIDVD